MLSEHGVAPALRSLARRSAVPVDLRIDSQAERYEESVEVTAYYVVSEALANVAKHAGATRAEVTVRASGESLALTVADDGRGGAEVSTGSGLTGLADRVEAVGGSMRIDSPPGEGTSVHVVLPIRSPA